MRCLFLILLLLQPVAAGAQTEPPETIRLAPVAFEALSGQALSPLGEKALAMDPKKWRHAETEHFIIHFRRATEAQRAVREVEYTLWYTARVLGAPPERYAKKSHVYIFSGTREWRTFLMETEAPPWFASFAMGDELYLNIGGIRQDFDSNTLAHETAHAVVARLYPSRRWPLWLNEGFAEYIGSASVAARKKQRLVRHQSELTHADLPLDTLFAMQAYPKTEEEVQRLYQTSERLVRFLMDELPADRFARFVDAMLTGKPFWEVLPEIYGDKIADKAAFNRRFIQ